MAKKITKKEIDYIKEVAKDLDDKLNKISKGEVRVIATENGVSLVYNKKCK
jgi:hypothetical protein